MATSYLEQVLNPPPPAAPPAAQASSPQATWQADMIVTIDKHGLRQIVSDNKNYILRAFKLDQEIKRLWLYERYPRKAIQYVCKIEPGMRRNAESSPLLQHGMFGNNDEDDDRSSSEHAVYYAYRILSV